VKLRDLSLFVLLCAVPLTQAWAGDTGDADAPATAAAEPQPQAEATTSEQDPAAEAPTKDVDQRKLAVAQELVKSFDMKSLSMGLMSAMMKSMLPVLDQENPGQNAKIEQITEHSLQKSLTARLPELEKNKAIVYAQMFSYDELQQLKTFYQSPVGQKLLQSTAEMMRRNATLDHSVMQAMMLEMRSQLLGDLKKNGMKIPKEAGDQ
jgi:hypothetical protein